MVILRLIALFAGLFSVAVGFGLLVGGVVVSAVTLGTRDDDGYFTASGHIENAANAVVSEQFIIASDGPWWIENNLAGLGAVRLRAESRDPGRGIFIGIGPDAEVRSYLSGVAYAEVVNLNLAPFEVTYRVEQGASSPVPPTEVNFWSASSTGTGNQTLDWSLRSGRWAIVLMHADGLPGIDADVAVGARVPFAVWIGPVLIGIGVIALLIGGLLLFLALRDPGTRGGGQPVPPSTQVSARAV